jgi:hypothetical protein
VTEAIMSATDQPTDKVTMTDFTEFQKIARWSRNLVITEKIDGTNAQVWISDDGLMLRAGSRNRWLTLDDDNFGFARWCESHRDELLALGPGRHFGEWWGSGIQRRYGLDEKRFSLFNSGRWHDSDAKDDERVGKTLAPACCHVVPVLLDGPNDQHAIEAVLDILREKGSYAAPGFMKPEGIVIYHCASRGLYKKTLEKDEVPKGLQRQAA